ncbi:WD repeat-containing protein 54 [Bulinus truncatus]|nr:WD repeat-containing protein 54 [Bulinus truncatus]
MYHRDKPIILKSSASSLCNNLAVYILPDKRQISYAVVHRSIVNLTCATTDGNSVIGRQVLCKEPSASIGPPFILQSKWVHLPSRTLFVLTSTRGIQMFEPDGVTLVYWHSFGDSVDESHVARGIAGVGEQFLCVGSDNTILVFNVPPKGTNVQLSDTLSAHKSPITDLASDNDTLVSADGLGTIIAWKLKGSGLTQVSNMRGDGWPCNSLAIWKGIVVGGYASGHLRVYNANTGVIGAEVAAHARAVNAIDISKENGMVLSVSDDTFLKIWQLRPLNAPQIEYRSAESVIDLQLVGGRFVDDQGRVLCVTGYDNSDIIFFIKN